MRIDSKNKIAFLLVNETKDRLGAEVEIVLQESIFHGNEEIERIAESLTPLLEECAAKFAAKIEAADILINGETQ